MIYIPLTLIAPILIAGWAGGWGAGVDSVFEALATEAVVGAA